MADLLDRHLTLTNYSEIDHTRMALGRWRDTEFYANDTWKFRPNVTLTLGLRYSQFPSAHVDNDQMSNFIPQFYDGVSYTSALITPATAGAHDLPRSLVKPYNGGFQPRVGIAWDVFGDGKTAVRAGFGRYMSRTNVIEDVNRMVGNPPWTKSVDSGWSGATDTLATCPTCRTMDAIGPGLVNQVVGVSQTGGFAAVDMNFRPPESFQWNLTVSREVMKNTVLEVVLYRQPRSAHLAAERELERRAGECAVQRQLQLDATCCQTTLDSRLPTNVRLGIDTDALVAANRRINTLGPITMAQSTGNSSYHGMQVWLNRRFADRLSSRSLTPGRTLFRISRSRRSPTPRRIHLITLSTREMRISIGGIRLSAIWSTSYQHSRNGVRSPALFWATGRSMASTLTSVHTPVDILSGVNTYGTAGNVNPRPNLVRASPST